MKSIVAFLMATIVAITSFAQPTWLRVAQSQHGIMSMKGLTSDNQGIYTAHFKIDYAIQILTDNGTVIHQSFMTVAMNCFTKESTLLADMHLSDGKVISSVTNLWVNTRDDKASTAAGAAVMPKICKSIT